MLLSLLGHPKEKRGAFVNRFDSLRASWTTVFVLVTGQEKTRQIITRFVSGIARSLKGLEQG